MEDKLKALSALRDDPSTDAARDELQKALKSKQGAVVAAAANVIADAELSGFDTPLAEAFSRFLADAKRDKGCYAKRAICDALYRLSARAEDVFLVGVRHVQMEPVWGGKEDTASDLRVVCALGLVRVNHINVMSALARLLADPEVMARIGAVRAISYSRDSVAGIPLLRFKALSGDEDARVTGACLAGLLALAPDPALLFVEEFLDPEKLEMFEAACVALGESRVRGALEVLKRASENVVSEDHRRPLFLGVAMLRSDDAWGHLLSLVEDGPEGAARDAIEALATFKHDKSLAHRVFEAADERADPTIQASARQAFD